MTASVPRLCRSAARSAQSAPSSNVGRQLPNLDGFNLGTSNTEDCLYLNVFTQVGYARKRSGRPVMIWIHGGGLIAGEANHYNASKLVTQGDVIVVTFNYLLGAFGFFAQPAIDVEHRPESRLSSERPIGAL